ncbi:MAG: FKBP-type peptidyl-prolyl cis-trans isomerase [Acidobacteriota bacterium]
MMRPTRPRALFQRLALALLPLAAAAASACGSSSPTSPSTSVGLDVPYSQSDLTVGAGTEATSGRRLAVNYTGWLYDSARPDHKGQQFDSSTGRGAFSFTLGVGQVIRGWDQGFTGMRVGGTRRLVVPPSLGYGAAGNGPIPGNATLVFDVELLGVQ